MSRIGALACLRPLFFCLTKNWTQIRLVDEEEYRVGCDDGVSSLLLFLHYIRRKKGRELSFCQVTKSLKLVGNMNTNLANWILTWCIRRGVAVDRISAPNKCRRFSRLNNGPEIVDQLLRVTAAKSYSAQNHIGLFKCLPLQDKSLRSSGTSSPFMFCAGQRQCNYVRSLQQSSVHACHFESLEIHRKARQARPGEPGGTGVRGRRPGSACLLLPHYR